MPEIKDALVDFNPWWKGEFVLDFKDREVYAEIKKFLPMPQIISLTGLRRVGKTTIMMKIAEDYIRRGFGPRSVIYFSFDEFKGAEIRDVIRAYEGLMEKSAIGSPCLLLLDEIQKLHDWESQIKVVYDMMGKGMKIIISGSESLFIRRKSKETLAGRIFEFKVEPLSFSEFIAFKGADMRPVGLHERELKKLFREFVLTMGFPELIGLGDKAVIKKYVMESIVEKIIYKDIPGLFPVKDTQILESLLRIFIEEPGQLVEISGLANDLGISRQALSSYLSYLEDSFLIRKLYNFSGARKSEKRLKKIYPAVASPDLLFKDDEHSQSRVFEWAVVNQLGAEFFWRDPYKNEVDAVIQTGQKPLPIEIKYGKADFGGLLAFMRKFKCNHGYLITREAEEKRKFGDKAISVVPAFKFLLEKKKYLGATEG